MATAQKSNNEIKKHQKKCNKLLTKLDDETPNKVLERSQLKIYFWLGYDDKYVSYKSREFHDEPRLTSQRKLISIGKNHNYNN